MIERCFGSAALGGLILGGCANNVGTTSLSSDSIIHGEADRRFAVQRMVKLDEEGKPKPTGRIVCVEPSPDVVKATDMALQIAGSLQTPDGSDVSASASSAIVESVSELGRRLATVQLLRDGLYRACEAYANGAMSPTSYNMLMSRTDDVMVTLFAMELASGTLPGQATIDGGAIGLGGAYGSAMQEEVNSKLERRTELSEELTQLQALDATQTPKVMVVDGKTDFDAEVDDEEAIAVDVRIAQVQALKAQTDRDTLSLMDRMRTAANFTLTGAFANASIVGGNSSTTEDRSQRVAEIQAAYMTDSNADALMVGCISELSKTMGDAEDWNAFARLCFGSTNDDGSQSKDGLLFIAMGQEAKGGRNTDVTQANAVAAESFVQAGLEGEIVSKE